MMEMDWSALALGLAVGVAASAAFFAGLGWGMRIALKSGRSAIILILSAIMRILALLWIGWTVVTFLGPVALLGFAVGFFIARTIATAIVRTGAPAGGAP